MSAHPHISALMSQSVVVPVVWSLSCSAHSARRLPVRVVARQMEKLGYIRGLSLISLSVLRTGKKHGTYARVL